MSLKFHIDAAKIASQFKEFATEIEQDLKKSIANLAAITHAKVQEMASQELKSSRKEFLDSLGFEEIADGIWVVSIDESGLWREEGIEPNFDMKPGLLSKNAKISKKGNKYKIIPFDYGKAPSQTAPSAQVIVNAIRQNLKRENVPFKKIERNPDGSPKTGKLHTFNFGNPNGRLGGPGRGTTPAMKGVSIYQTITKSGNVRRDILTFRTVSSGPGSEGKWIHPGSEAKKFLDRALEFSINEFENKILPEILEKWG